FGIRIVADFVSIIVQFTTKFYAGYNVHIYYYFGYYFYTLLQAAFLYLTSFPPVFISSSTNL
ncbi:MAG: hypothetical protein L3J54_03650, partial [Draconibacterium sp.]|nr:hypothetical protein [Draconibacterium sp.]